MFFCRKARFSAVYSGGSGIMSGSLSLNDFRTSFSVKSKKVRRGGDETLRHVSGKDPPWLIKHVLTVLVFWSWVLLLPRLPPLSRSLRLFPWASIFASCALGRLLGSAARSSPTTCVANASALHRGQNPQNREKRVSGSKNSHFPVPQKRAL